MYYKKIFIKSKDDLPKEKGKYIFGWDKTETSNGNGISQLLHSPKDDDETLAELVEDYDWFLQPVQEELYPKSFIEWKDMNAIVFITDKSDIVYQLSKGIYDNCDYTLKELFEYWQTNIKDK